MARITLGTRKRLYTDANILDRLRDMARELKRSPGQRDLGHGRLSYSLIRKRFGTMAAALRLAGLKLPNRQRNKLTTEQRAEIARRFKPKAHGNASALAKEYGVTLSRIHQIARGQ